MCKNIQTNIVQISKNLVTVYMSNAEEWINMPWSIQTIEHCIAVKMNEPQLHATTQMNLANVMNSQGKQIAEDHIA